MLLSTTNIEARTMQIRLMQDCAEICATSAKYFSRQSPFAKSMIKKCVEICETCGRECSRFPDETSQYCASACFNCAKECREYLTSH